MKGRRGREPNHSKQRRLPLADERSVHERSRRCRNGTKASTSALSAAGTHESAPFVPTRYRPLVGSQRVPTTTAAGRLSLTPASESQTTAPAQMSGSPQTENRAAGGGGDASYRVGAALSAFAGNRLQARRASARSRQPGRCLAPMGVTGRERRFGGSRSSTATGAPAGSVATVARSRRTRRTRRSR